MESLAGSRLGRFRITRLIGKGGMGEVYSAIDESLDREVAVKVLGSAVDVEPHRRRFLREARLAARLNHPNIASIHEVGDTDGRRYIVMELLEGKTLRVLLGERRLTVDECISIARDVARALARAHAGDVIHRDIKPENIFITTPAPGVLFAKVLDFGLARDELVRKRNDDEDTATDLTGPGEACGTAGYLAPEQARGLAVDARADLFSCGAVFYEMLTGQRAFDGRNQLARMLAVVKQTPEPLAKRAPDVTPELAAVVERCLAKAPADRYEDGAGLVAALDELLRSSQRMLSSPDLSARTSSPGEMRVSTGPELPVAMSSAAMRAATRDGSSGTTKSVSTVSTISSVTSQSRRAFALPPPIQRNWPLFAAAAGGLFVAAIVIGISSSSSRPRAAAQIAAPTARLSEVSGARQIAEGPASEGAGDDPPGSKNPGTAVAVPVAAAAPRTGRPADRRPAPFTRLPTIPFTAAPATASAPPSVAASASPAPPPSQPPPPPVEPARTGTIRFQTTDVMTIVVDGEHRRLRDGTVTLACGRHRVRVGLNNERFVDVPCGGSVLF